jgi:hypothetical protein
MCGVVVVGHMGARPPWKMRLYAAAVNMRSEMQGRKKPVRMRSTAGVRSDRIRKKEIEREKKRVVWSFHLFSVS